MGFPLKTAERVREKILTILKEADKPVSSKELLARIGCSEYDLAKALLELSKEGIIKRIYTEGYNPIQPFFTSSWKIVKEALKDRLVGVTTKESKVPMQLVASVPVTLNRESILNKYGFIDFSDAYINLIEASENELKIACPYIDEFGFSFVITRMKRTQDLCVRVLTELSKSQILLYYKRIFGRRLQVRDFSQMLELEGRTRPMKITGLHTKLLIADNSTALLGSFNLSKYHWLVNFDLGLLIYEPKFVRQLSSIFEELWSLARTL